MTYSKHLAAGSQQPPKVEGKLRLYSMEFCPYAQRVRLVLNAKKIPHDIVNIDLMNKPEWYFKIHPEGKVPAIDTGSEIVIESLDVSDYLDEKYPERPLYPADPEERKRDKALIEKIGPLTGDFSQIFINKDGKSPAEWAQLLRPHLEIFEDALKRKGTTYFGGDQPGMVDYMLWPWGERSAAVPLTLGERLPFDPEEFPLLRRWRKAMRSDPPASSTYHKPEIFLKIVQSKLKNLPADYDNVEP